MYLRAKKRIKDGKEHRYWSIVESCRNLDGGVSFSAKCSISAKSTTARKPHGAEPSRCCKSIPVPSRWRCFPPTDPPRSSNVKWCRSNSTSYGSIIRVSGARVGWRSRCGSSWKLDRFWRDRLPASRQGTKWLEVLKTQVCYQLIDPGSEWRLHRHWYAHSAMRDLLGSPVRVLSDDTLYRCLDKLLAHKRAFFSFSSPTLGGVVPGALRCVAL